LFQFDGPTIATSRLSHGRSCPGKNQVAPSRRPKGGTTRYRRYWDTVSLEVLWIRASKTVSHEGADLKLDALANMSHMSLEREQQLA